MHRARGVCGPGVENNQTECGVGGRMSYTGSTLKYVIHPVGRRSGGGVVMVVVMVVFV